MEKAVLRVLWKKNVAECILQGKRNQQRNKKGKAGKIELK